MTSKYRTASISRSGDVAFRRVVDEIILLPIREDPSVPQAVCSLNPTATAIWEALDGGARLDDLVNAVIARFEVDEARAREDVEALLDDLASLGAIVVDVDG